MEGQTNNYFDRQKRIPEWKQDVIEQQVCFVLGVGGVGCTVALDLVRLGVQKIFILDKDVVDENNLNRQILYSKEDVGKSKVESAKKVTLIKALEQHNLRTEIIALHLDALLHWDTVVNTAKMCNVIFQGIDVGDYFDLACQSLAYNLKIPYILGGTFQSTITVDFIGPHGKPCWCCLNDVNDKQLKAKLLPSQIESYKTVDFISKDDHPVGASCVYVASTSSNLMVSLFVQYLNGIKVPSRTIFYYNTYEFEKWDVSPEKNCHICGDVSPQ